jgi:LmbE family N-acetylglucosaminyl deacetylase
VFLVKKVLVLVSHPDDELLGCGGTILKHLALADIVKVVIFGRGVSSRFEKVPANQIQNEVAICAQSLHQEIGSILEIFDLPDNACDSLPLLEVIRLVESITKEFKPDIVYCQHGGDLNIDHQILFRSIMTALRPTPEIPTQFLATFETLSSTEYSFNTQTPIFYPNFYVDISGYLEAKCQLLERFYGSELRTYPHPRSIEAVRAKAIVRGSEIGFAASEAFKIVWAKSY